MESPQPTTRERTMCIFQKGMVEGYENFTSFGIKQMSIFVKSISVGIDTDWFLKINTKIGQLTDIWKKYQGELANMAAYCVPYMKIRLNITVNALFDLIFEWKWRNLIKNPLLKDYCITCPIGMCID